jgi:hypothetical protein
MVVTWGAAQVAGHLRASGAFPVPTALRATATARPDSLIPFGSAAEGTGEKTFGPLHSPLVAIAADSRRPGAWLAGADGGKFTTGAARFFGSLGSEHLSAPVVALAATPGGGGYWLASANGAIHQFGDAHYYGSASGLPLNEPIVGMAATPDGHGYWLASADGGIFAFGNATFRGAATATRPTDPIVGMAATSDGKGYWLVSADGNILSFGDAHSYGSTEALNLRAPIVAIAATDDARGYWLVAADGGVFAFGDATFHGSAADAVLGGTPVVSIAPTTAGGGYWLATGEPPQFSAAAASYVATRSDNVTAAVYDITTGQTYSFRAGLVEHTASTVKVDILATLLTQTQVHGALPASLQSLAVPMIEDSLDSAADALWVRLGPEAVGGFEHAAGMTSTVPATDGIWGTTTTTVEDRLTLLRAVVFPNGILDDQSRAYILELMKHVTPSQDWGATGGVPHGVVVALKNGFAPIIGWQINTEAWVDGDGRDYLIAVLTDHNPTEAYGIATVNAISSIAWRLT